MSDLTAASFMPSFRRFIARRGLPATIYSENALTFTGACKEIQTLWKMLRQKETRDFHRHAENQMEVHRRVCSAVGRPVAAASPYLKTVARQSARTTNADLRGTRNIVTRCRGRHRPTSAYISRVEADGAERPRTGPLPRRKTTDRTSPTRRPPSLQAGQPIP